MVMSSSSVDEKALEFVREHLISYSTRSQICLLSTGQLVHSLSIKRLNLGPSMLQKTYHMRKKEHTYTGKLHWRQEIHRRNCNLEQCRNGL